MATTSELATLHRALAELRAAVDSIRGRYGEIPAVKRLLGDLERIHLDSAELDVVTPAEQPSDQPVQLIDDDPVDPLLWADADDEGLGGYRR